MTPVLPPLIVTLATSDAKLALKLTANKDFVSTVRASYEL